jgi:hypothetical protein
MNATWNSEPLFTAFACDEEDAEMIVETAEDGVTVICADNGDSEFETIEVGNLVSFLDDGPRASRSLRPWRASQQMRGPCGSQSACNALGQDKWRVPLARVTAKSVAGTPLFLAA